MEVVNQMDPVISAAIAGGITAIVAAIVRRIEKGRMKRKRSSDGN